MLSKRKFAQWIKNKTVDSCIYEHLIMSIYVAIVVGDAKHSCRMKLFGNLDKKQQDDGPKPFRYKYSDIWKAISQDLEKEYLHMPEKHAEALQKLLAEADIVRRTKSKKADSATLAFKDCAVVPNQCRHLKQYPDISIYRGPYCISDCINGCQTYLPTGKTAQVLEYSGETPISVITIECKKLDEMHIVSFKKDNEVRWKRVPMCSPCTNCNDCSCRCTGATLPDERRKRRARINQAWMALGVRPDCNDVSVQKRDDCCLWRSCQDDLTLMSIFM